MNMAALLICGLLLTSCDVDNSDTKSGKYSEQIADTRWQLSEIRDTGNEWQTPLVYTELDIQDLQFIGDRRYKMTIRNFYGDKGVNTFQGSYSVDGSTINFTGDPLPGIFISISVIRLDDTMLEGNITLWADEQITYSPDGTGTTISTSTRNYTIRLKRIK